MPRTHYLSDEHLHHKWDTGNEPLITIDSGDTVVVWTRDISDNQVARDSDASALAGTRRIRYGCPSARRYGRATR
jgi:acetamidase/formamidase